MPDKPALIVQARVCTYAQLETATQRTADALRDAGVVAGRKVALTAPNGPEFVAALMGILRAGAVAVPAAANMQAPERAAMLEQVRCEYQLGLVRPEADRVLAFRGFDDAAAQELYLAPTAHQHGEPVDKRLLDLGASNIRFTSGTTAAFKGVVLSHEGIGERIEAANRALNISDQDTIFFALDMAHHFAVSVTLHLSVGATIVTGSLFLCDTMVKQIHRHGATVVYSTPVTYRLLADAPDVEPEAFRNVRLAISTAMPLGRDLETRFEERWHVPLMQALGIIEVGMPIMNLPHPRRVRGSLGRLIDGFEARVVDEDGRDVAGVPGELWLRGPGMLAAYYTPWRLRDAILHEGWFRTGDVVRRDEDGNFFLMGRTKNLINVGGTKIFPAEIEEVLTSHDAVAEAVVAGAPDDVLGEVPAATVVLRDGCETTPEALAAHCRRHLSHFKVPRRIQIVPDLPRTHSGKIARARAATG